MMLPSESSSALRRATTASTSPVIRKQSVAIERAVNHVEQVLKCAGYAGVVGRLQVAAIGRKE